MIQILACTCTGRSWSVGLSPIVLASPENTLYFKSYLGPGCYIICPNAKYCNIPIGVKVVVVVVAHAPKTHQQLGWIYKDYKPFAVTVKPVLTTTCE